MTVFGTRPDTIKMAPVVRALEAARPHVEPIVCVTAQHRQMLDDLLALFRITPEYDLDVMTHGQTLTEITTRVLDRMVDVFAQAKPDVVLVHGDTTTSTASALAAFYARVPVGHVEAGLRTSTILEPFPEEMNRRVTGVLARYHFAPTERSRDNLYAERVERANVYVTGNTVIDAFEAANARNIAEAHHVPVLAGLDPARPMIYVTAHRRENHEIMGEIARAIVRIAGSASQPQIVWPVHPSPMVEPVVRAVVGATPNIHLCTPLGYADSVACVAASTFVLTDSGGLQEEAPTLGKPVLVMRNETERPEGLDAGTLRLIGNDPETIVREAEALLTDTALYARMAHAANPYGDGRAADRIVAWLLWKHGTVAGDEPRPFALAHAT
jgi:UDP-N-acetylglucosamine 2-epimerase (non-hydrolysing)